MEDRDDFEAPKDGSFWPIRIQEGGNLYQFCPGKATWDISATLMFKALIVAVETGTLWQAGGIKDQPGWFMDLLGWFAPMYDNVKFSSRARQFLGGAKDGGPKATDQDIRRRGGR